MLRHEFCRDHCKNYRSKFNDRKHWYCCVGDKIVFKNFLGIVDACNYVKVEVTSSSDVPKYCPYSLEHLFETEYRLPKSEKG